MLNNQKNIKVDKYNIWGNIVHMHSSHKNLLETIRKYWSPFYSQTGLLKPKAIFYITKYNIINTLRKGQYFSNDNFLLMLDSHRYVTCNLYKEPWQVYIQASNVNNNNFVYSVLFEPVFLNILRRLNLFRLHSAAVTKDGYGIVIPGAPGSGKTTTTLRLMKSGFKVLTDERLFLQKDNSDIYALGFDEEIFITDKTISFFPELKFLKETPLYKRGVQFKRRLEIKKVYPNSIAKKTKVHLLIFPKITANQKTRIEPLPKHNAFVKMLNRGITPPDLKDDIALTNQIDLYSNLIQSVRAYNLFMGKRLDEIPKLISGLF